MKYLSLKKEAVVIAGLIFLLAINSGSKDPSSTVLAAEHRNGIIESSDTYQTGAADEADDAMEAAQNEPDASMNGTENGLEDTQDELVTVDGEDASDETDPADSMDAETEGMDPEVKAAYLAAFSYEVPENIAFAMVEDSLSVRKEAAGESKQIGILYPGNYCLVQEVNGEWAKITSGSVSGYCRVKYLLRGDEAITYAKEHVKCIAKTTANVNIRSSATTLEDNVLNAVEKGHEYAVLTAAVRSDDPDAPLFVKVSYEGQEAYLAIGKVALTYYWKAGQKYQEPAKEQTAAKPEPTQKPAETEKVEDTKKEDDNKKDDAAADSSSDAASEEKQDSSQEDDKQEEVKTPAVEGISETKEEASSNDALRASIASLCKKYVGLKYVYGGTSLKSGCDCSGFVLAIYRAAGAEMGNKLPRTSVTMSKSSLGKKITYAEAKPGDLMFYGSGGKSTVDHVAIYIGNGKIIHESSVAGKVIIDDWNYRNPLVIRSFLGE